MGLGILATVSSGFADDGGRKYEVTVTNLTHGQPLTPVVIATHTKEFTPLFEVGKLANPELIEIAEDADVGPMVDLLTQNPHVKDVVVLQGTAPLPTLPDGPGGFAIRPGESASVNIKFDEKAKFLSLASMLANTNDAFIALRGVAGPGAKTVTYYSVAWDSGSEVNNEDCEVVPGPACLNFFAPAKEGAEGFVHIHRGIHGVGDLVPALHDWRNPVAKITVKRLSPGK
jgi:hypothetical protein